MLFKNIIGHAEVKKRLISSVKENRISHAQLFLGNEGCGKLALAIAYAQYIMCTNKQNEDACGVCTSCQKINKLEHPDLHFFFPAVVPSTEQRSSNIIFAKQWREFVLSNNYYVSLSDWFKFINAENKQGIIRAQDCNEITRKINLKSYESSHKIIIIYMAEKLYHSAAPKLLKAFEEPPENTLFILLAENQDLILKTILSRVQLLKVPNHKHADITQYLQKHHAFETQDAAVLAKISDGNIINAVKLFQNSADVQLYLNNFILWMRYCYGNDFIAIIEWIEEMSKKSMGREKLKSFFLFALNIARNSIYYNCKSEHLTAATKEEMEFLTKFHPFINERNIERFYEELNTALFHIERNLNPKIVLMDTSFKLMRLMAILKKN